MRVIPYRRAHVCAFVRAILGFGWLVLAGCGGRAPTAPTPTPVASSPTPAASYALRGMVTAASGSAIPSATIEVTAGVNLGRTIAADAEGHYVLTALEPGTMTVQATAGGYQSVRTAIALDSDRTLDFTLPTADSPPAPPAAPERATLTGIVRAVEPGGSTSMRVVSGAQLFIPSGPNGGRTAVTGETGAYIFNDLTPGDADVRVSAPGNLTVSRRVTLGAEPTVDFALSPDPAFTTSGRAVDAIDGKGLAGITVEVEGLPSATSGADGAFLVRTDSPATAIRVATFRGPGVVDRRTGLRVPGPSASAPLIPTDFDLASFDQMLRSPQLIRWTTDPPLRIERRVLTISDVNAATGAASNQMLTDADVDALQGDLTWALPQLTGGTYQAFATVTIDLPAEGADVPLLNTGLITVARVEGLTEATGYDGYGRWQYDGAGAVTGGVILLDAAFERSGNAFARTLHAHELGHALGYQHVTLRASVMNADARLEPTMFDLDACRIAFQRQPGNQSPDVDPDPSSISINRRSARRTWSAAIR